MSPIGRLSIGSLEVVAYRVGGRSRSRLHTELAEDVRDMPHDSVMADEQVRRDLAIGLALDDQAQHVQFARCQATVSRKQRRR